MEKNMDNEVESGLIYVFVGSMYVGPFILSHTQGLL